MLGTGRSPKRCISFTYREDKTSAEDVIDAIKITGTRLSAPKRERG